MDFLLSFMEFRDEQKGFSHTNTIDYTSERMIALSLFASIGQVIITSVVSIVVLFCMCKWIGQRQISQMSMFDYINSITIGSIAAELATDLEHWWLPLTATLVYGTAVVLINFLCRKSLPVRSFINGRPLILLEKDTLHEQNLKKSGFDLNEFLTQCRISGYFDLQQIDTALLETSGHISFLPKSNARPLTPSDMEIPVQQDSMPVPVILDGTVLEVNLKHLGREMRWLTKELQNQGIKQPSEVLLAMCSPDGTLVVYAKDK